MTKKTLKAKIKKGYLLDCKIKEMTKELKLIKEDLKDEAYDDNVKMLDGGTAIAIFAETSKTILTESPENIYKNLKKKSDFLKIAVLNIPLCRKFFGSRDFNKMTSIKSDSHGKIAFKAK